VGNNGCRRIDGSNDRAGGEVSLEKCLCLPTAAKRRRSERDVWLRAVAGFVGAGQPTLVAREVAGRLAVFMTRGPWREWRELRDPPAHATDLQRALFGAARASGGNPPQWRQVLRVLDGGVIKESGSDNRVR